MSIEIAKADLAAKVGKETFVSDWLTITQERINQFAEATGDHQWIHVDQERADRESPFGTTVAHGYLTLSLLPFLSGSVNAEKPPYPGIKLGINYGLNKVRFPNPVKVGSRVRLRNSLVSFEEVKGNGIQLVNQAYIEIEGQPKPGCVAETVSRFYF
jgi:acyl dehydratase